MSAGDSNKIIFLTDGSQFANKIIIKYSKYDYPFKIVILSYNFRKRRLKESTFSYLVYIIKRAIKNSYLLKRLFYLIRTKYYYKAIKGGLTNSKRLIKILKKLKPDYIIICGGGILSDDVIRIPKYGIINVHPGFLPYVRGVDVLYHSIINNYPLGATAHFIDNGIDTGDIICNKLININKNDSMNQLKSKMQDKVIELYLEIFYRIIFGKPLNPIKQEGKYKYCGKVSSEGKKLALSLIDEKIYYNNYNEILEKYNL